MTTDCSRARQLLSEYIDGMLDPETTASVDSHMTACPACRQELEALKSVVNELGALERIQAPPDFLNRIHRRLESGFNFRHLLGTLFIPLRTKLPLELAGATAAAVLIFFIWNIQQKDQQTLTVQHSAPGTAIMEQSEPSVEKDSEKPAPVLKKAPAARRALNVVRKSLSDSMTSPAQRGQPRVVPVIDLVLVLKERRKDRLNRGENKPVESMPPGKKQMVHSADADMDISSESVRSDRLLEKIEALIKLEEGKLTNIKKHSRTDRTTALTIEAPAGRYASILDRLAAFGSFDPPPAPSLRPRDGMIRLRIRWVHPE